MRFDIFKLNYNFIELKTEVLEKNGCSLLHDQRFIFLLGNLTPQTSHKHEETTSIHVIIQKTTVLYFYNLAFGQQQTNLKIPSRHTFRKIYKREIFHPPPFYTIGYRQISDNIFQAMYFGLFPISQCFGMCGKGLLGVLHPI